ncbi:tripartite tricarboxylate transporter substrate binding protein [uncultured Pseudacidovorax sp.]|uniref:Bug family tripartite tricarboxylate transporter substrate binding protein n=1 Tax=uncultured Pseudacidovorax sp. TaxID=679313 RepID=UPI0025FCED13|nr:tripartite tricarboxylate transporter substrate binding protein [uncultured Pseudacidovorax sp.]
MTTSTGRRHLLRLSALALATFTLGAHAEQPWPEAKPITWIVGFVPGGTVDVLTRAFAKAVSDQIGQTIVIDNVPGASGALALKQAARAKPDGYTLVTVPGPVLFGQQQPEVGRELQAVGLLSQGPIVLVGGASLAPTDLGALIAAMKKNPQQWDYASSGIGTGQHLAGELFNQLAGTQMLHVPYKGGGQAVVDVVGGQVKLGMLGVTPVLSQIKAGQLRAYAVTTPYRIPSLPNVPTMSEAGLKGYEATQYFAVAGAKGLPEPVVARLNAAIAKAAESPQVQAALEAGGQLPGRMSPAEAQKFVQDSLRKFGDVATKAHIVLN